MANKNPAHINYIIPMIIVIGIIVYGLLNELVLKPNSAKLACADLGKKSISLYRAIYGSIPASFESMASRLNEKEEYRGAMTTLGECIRNTPLDYQRRINGDGYKIIYIDVLGKERNVEVDFGTDFE